MHKRNEPPEVFAVLSRVLLLLRRSQPFELGYRLFISIKPLAYVVGSYTCQYGENEGYEPDQDDGKIAAVAISQHSHHDNIICLPGEPIGCDYLRSEPWMEGGTFMSTYEEFMVLLTFAILIITILEYVSHKK